MQPLYWGIFMTEGNYLKVLIFLMALGTSPLAVSEELAKSLNVLTLRELESEMINQSLDIKLKAMKSMPPKRSEKHFHLIIFQGLRSMVTLSIYQKYLK